MHLVCTFFRNRVSRWKITTPLPVELLGSTNAVAKIFKTNPQGVLYHVACFTNFLKTDLRYLSTAEIKVISSFFCQNKHLTPPKGTKGNIPWKFCLQILSLFLRGDF